MKIVQINVAVFDLIDRTVSQEAEDLYPSGVRKSTSLLTIDEIQRWCKSGVIRELDAELHGMIPSYQIVKGKSELYCCSLQEDMVIFV